jgi:putative transposase
VRLKYALISQLSADYSVRRLCLTLKVHASGYYAWLAEPKSARAKDEQRLLGLIKHSWLESGGVYGYRSLATTTCVSLEKHAASIVLLD